MGTTTIFFMGKANELRSAIGGSVYLKKAPGHFHIDPPVIVITPDQDYTFNGISIGPYFSGSLLFDDTVEHQGNFNIYFSCGNEAHGSDYISLTLNPQMLQIMSNGWFRPHNNEHLLLCDPVVYFTFDRKTNCGTLRFEFTDYWSGTLECTIDSFIKKGSENIPQNLIVTQT